jgi:hypothetical protein
MGSCEHRWLCFGVGLSLLAGSFLSTGCRTAANDSLFTASGPGWRVQQGQALWRPGRNYPELGGEVVVASHPDGRCSVEFVKTPIPLVLAQTSSTNWLVEFPPRQMSFAGKGNPPPRFLWLCLGAALAGESLPDDLHFSRKPDGGWKLENTKSGETLEGYLEP